MEVRTNSATAYTGAQNFITKVTSRNHSIVADEPADHGGSDLGMTPHDLLIAALASCTSITLKMYADRKGWKLDKINVQATIERKIESGVQTTKAIQILELTGDLDDTMKQRLLDVGSRCPVHKTLAPAMKIEIHLKP